MTLWQNSIRELMEMETIPSSYPIRVALIALVTAIILMIIVRALINLAAKLIKQVNRVLPHRVSIVSGLLLRLCSSPLW